MIQYNRLFITLKIFFLLFISIPQTSFGSEKIVKSGNLDEPVVVVIPIQGTVDKGMASYLARSLHDAQKHLNRIIILEMDTFGGEVDAAFQMVDSLVNQKDTTIAYVKTKAISAGALIALACNKLYMKNSTTIGDVAPLIYGNEGPTMLGEKFQSPIRAKFRTLAKRNGYPERLTEAMVSENMVVYQVIYHDSTRYLDSAEYVSLTPAEKKKIVSSKIVDNGNTLLTMDDVEAHALGFSRKSVGSFDDLLKVLGLENANVIRIQENWSETFVRFVGTIAPILIMIGFAALYIETRTPGFGLPGIIGITCLAIVFLSQYMAGLANYTELLLMVIGIVLIAIEVLVLPGFGIAGIAGIVVLMIGIVLSFQDFVIPDPKIPLQTEILTKNLVMVLSSIIGSIILIVLFFRFIFPKLGAVVKGPYLNETLHGATASDQKMQSLHIGDSGTAHTPLRPAGKILVNGETFDVVTEGDFIEKGSAVTVSSITGSRVTVQRKVEA